MSLMSLDYKRLTSILLVPLSLALLVYLLKASCHVVSCSIERLSWQGTEGSDISSNPISLYGKTAKIIFISLVCRYIHTPLFLTNVLDDRINYNKYTNYILSERNFFLSQEFDHRITRNWIHGFNWTYFSYFHFFLKPICVHDFILNSYS